MKILKKPIALLLTIVTVIGLALPMSLAAETDTGEGVENVEVIENVTADDTGQDTGQESDPDPSPSSDWDWSIMPSLTDPEDFEDDTSETPASGTETEISIEYAAAEDLLSEAADETVEAIDDTEAITDTEGPSIDDVIETELETDEDTYYVAEVITFDDNMEIVDDSVYEQEAPVADEDDIMLLSLDGGFTSDTTVNTTVQTTGETAKSEISSNFSLYGSASTGWYSWNGSSGTYVSHPTGVPERVHWLHTWYGNTYVAYCIQPWKNSSTTSSYVYSSNATAITNTLSGNKLAALALALLYGYSYNSDSSGNYVQTGMYSSSWAFYGTQMIVWEILADVRNVTAGSSYFNRQSSSGNSDYAVFQAFYNKTVSGNTGYFANWSSYRFIGDCIHFHGQLPSWAFDTDEEAAENALSLTYNESSGRYEATIHNTNEILNDNYYHTDWGYSIITIPACRTLRPAELTGCRDFLTIQTTAVR